MDTPDSIDIPSRIGRSLVETFGTLLSLDIQPADIEPPTGSGVQRMVGTINFAGQITGIFNLQVTVDFGRVMAAARRGQAASADAADRDARDLIAEITRTVGGDLQSALNDAGHACLLTTPSIAAGTDFTIRSLSMDRFERRAFQCADHLVVAEVGLKWTSSADGGLAAGSPETASRMPEADLEALAGMDFKAQLSAAAIDVFHTLHALTLTPTEGVDAADPEGVRAVAWVCFAGDATGIVSVHVPGDLARIMAAGKLGVDPEKVEGEEEIRDLMGEIGNILGGNLTSALTATGLRCALAPASCIAGSDVTIESLDLERYERCTFACEGRTVVVGMGLKVSDLVTAAPAAAKDIHDKAGETQAGLPGSRPPAAGRAPAPPQGQPLSAIPARAAGEASPAASAPEDLGLEILLDIPMELTVELGRTKLPIRDLLKLSPGAAVKLAKFEGEPVDILANDVLIARGEVVVRKERYGIRITEITSRLERLKGLR